MAWVKAIRMAGRPPNSQKASKCYSAWIRMRRRCHNPKDKDWRYYGGRGIVVCDEWRWDYATFRAWAIKNGIRRGRTLDRIDNDGNYEPGNCQWVPQSLQSRNRSLSKFTEADVLHIRRTKMPVREVAKRWRVRYDYAAKIVSGKYVWSHIKP